MRRERERAKQLRAAWAGAWWGSTVALVLVVAVTPGIARASTGDDATTAESANTAPWVPRVSTTLPPPQLGRSGPPARILSPAPGQVLLGGWPRLAVRYPPGSTGIQATLNGHALTQPFRPGPGHTRVVRLRGDGLRDGYNSVRVRLASLHGSFRYGRVRFVLARRDRRLLRAVRARPDSRGHVLLRLFGLTRGAVANVRVNGRRVARVRGAGARSLALGAAQNLRPGSNRVAVLVLDRAAGGYRRALARVRISERYPLPAASIARRVIAGVTTYANASRSRPGRGGLRLRYRWTIVRRPHGSRARLRDATRARPVLRPDRPGRYVLRVRVTQTRPGAGAAAHGGATVATSSTAITSFAASEPVPALGDPIDTITHHDGKLGVEIQRAGDATPEFFPSNPAQALQLVVLPRTPNGSTSAAAASYTFANDVNGVRDLASKVSALGDDKLVVITKPDPAVTEAGSSSTAIAQSLGAILKQIGVTPPPDDVMTGTTACGGTAPCSAFSAIGVPQTQTGGTISPGLRSTATATDDASPPASGSLVGFLALDNQGGFTFVNRQRVIFDSDDHTDAPAKSTQAKVTIGPTTYPSATLASGTPGFYVLVLDAGDLTKRAEGTFAEATQLGAMSQLLKTWSSDPAALIVIQSIGTVGRNATTDYHDWDLIAQQISALGGSDKYFEALNTNTSNQYAQIGPGGSASVLGPITYPSPWTQVASTDRSGTGRITGLLARDPASQFYPDESRQPGQPLDGTLTGLISQEPVDPVWPDRTGGKGNAMACIAANMVPKLPLPIESAYGNTNIDWSGRSGQLDNMSATALRTNDPTDCQSTTRADGSSNTNGFSDQDFEDARKELLGEWSELGDLRQWITNMKSPMTQSNTATVLSTATAVNDTLGTENSQQSVNVDYVALTSNILWILSAIPGPQSEVLNLFSGLTSLADEFAAQPDGQPELRDVTTPAAQFATQLQAQYQASLEGLDDAFSLIASDRGALEVAAENIADSPNATYNWAWDSQAGRSYAIASNALTLSAERDAYETLFPLRYKLFRIQSGTVPLYYPDIDRYQCAWFGLYHAETFNPFSGTPQYGGWNVAVSSPSSTSATPTTEMWSYAGPDAGFLTLGNNGLMPTQNAQFPAPATLLQMFKNTDQRLSPAQPIFTPLQFALETYHNGIGAPTVKNVQGRVDNEDSNLLCQLGTATS